jgi:hypothetical protein
MRGASSAGERLETLARRCVEDAHEVLEILSDDNVVRHPKRCLLAIRSNERCSVPLGEKRDRECDREERDSRNGSSRPASQSERSESRRHVPRAPIRSEARECRKDPSDGECGRNRDEAWQEEEQ